MENVFNNIIEAKAAADKFFLDTFGYTKGASRHYKLISENEEETVVEFHSIDDPAMDDTFTATIQS